MTSPRLRDHLRHMLVAAREVLEFVEGLDREAFIADRRTQQAVVMNLLIIGEAAAKILDADPEFARSHSGVPWRNMRGMRNRMIHGYFETNFDLVWETVSIEIPPLIVRPSGSSTTAATEAINLGATTGPPPAPCLILLRHKRRIWALGFVARCSRDIGRGSWRARR